VRSTAVVVPVRVGTAIIVYSYPFDNHRRVVWDVGIPPLSDLTSVLDYSGGLCKVSHFTVLALQKNDEDLGIKLERDWCFLRCTGCGVVMQRWY